MQILEEYMQANAIQAYERIWAMAAEGAEAMVENRQLRDRIYQLELEVQRLRFAVKTQQELKRRAYLQCQELYVEKERLVDLLAGRIERGKVDPAILTRGLLEIIKWSDDGNDPDDPDGDGPDRGEEVPNEQVC